MEERNRALLAVAEKLQEQVSTQERRIADLEERLGRNSQNSSRPPSSDPPTGKASQRRQPSGRSRGGQPGHPGAHRELLPPDRVNKVVEHFPEGCGKCGLALPPEFSQGDPFRKQVSEIVPAKTVVTEHRVHSGACPRCGALCCGSLGLDVPSGDFGPRAEATIAYLGAAFRLSVRERQRLLEEFFGLAVSTGGVKAIDSRVSASLSACYEEALEWVRRSPVANADETSWPLAGALGWLWTAVTQDVTVFRLDPQRSGNAFERLLGTEFSGILGCDRLASYDRLSEDNRQHCWAHLHRDFEGFARHTIPEVRQFGECGLFITDRLFKAWGTFCDEHHDRARLHRALAPIRADMAALLITGVLSPQPRVPGFCYHLLKRAGALWQFAETPGVEPTNNSAERALRPAVLWRKGSFGSRSEHGQRFVERLLTVVATLRRQGRDVLEFLVAACSSALHGLAPPSLLPPTASSA